MGALQIYLLLLLLKTHQLPQFETDQFYNRYFGTATWFSDDEQVTDRVCRQSHLEAHISAGKSCWKAPDRYGKTDTTSEILSGSANDL